MSVEFSSLKVLFEFENDHLVQTEYGKSISHYRFITSEIPCKKTSSESTAELYGSL